METIIRMRPSELNLDFLKALQLMLVGQDEVEIIVRTESLGFPPSETKEGYWNRLEKARQRIEAGENLISFTPEEFEEMAQKLLKR
ncbi:MAG: hypothetical protein LH606_14895 [Cytophagaceae bacterium]|nr:hypothetical protein [Cytophagaceae bacterium]